MDNICTHEAQEKSGRSFTEIIYSAIALKKELGLVFVTIISLHLELFREMVSYVFHHVQNPIELQWNYLHGTASFAL